MNITEVRVTPLSSDGKIKAMASITIDNCFVVTGIKIMDGSKGLFIAMPSRKGNNDKYYDICYPIDKDTREAIRDMVLAKYTGGVQGDAYEPEYRSYSDTIDDDDELPF